jgi:hypothetical protein
MPPYGGRRVGAQVGLTGASGCLSPENWDLGFGQHMQLDAWTTGGWWSTGDGTARNNP